MITPPGEIEQLCACTWLGRLALWRIYAVCSDRSEVNVSLKLSLLSGKAAARHAKSLDEIAHGNVVNAQAEARQAAESPGFNPGGVVRL